MADLPFLDMERRVGVKKGEIDDFLEKVDAVEEAIRGLKVRSRQLKERCCMSKYMTVPKAADACSLRVVYRTSSFCMRRVCGRF
jgi:hypothetical protein